MIKYLFFLCCILLGGIASAQSYTTIRNTNKKTLKCFKQGLEYSRKGENKEAEQKFLKALKSDPNFIDAKIELAAVKSSTGDYDGTVRLLKEVVDVAPNYRPKLAYSLAFYAKKNGDCSQATTYANKYIQGEKTIPALVEKSENIIKNCEFLKTALTNVPFEPQRFDFPINTTLREYFPALTADGNTLFFTRVVSGQEDLYVSNFQGGKWSDPQALSYINTDENEGNQSISADGKLIVFTACNRKDGYGSCDLYYSEYKQNEWQSPRNLGNRVNSKNWESQPSVSADGQTIYFTSKREGGTGKADIYVTRRNDDGSWSVAKEISGAINTADDEQTPFIHADNQTLYFKSKGHPGFGGYDLYYSRKQNDGSWGSPQNLGSPINSDGDEGSLIVSLDGKRAFFDADRGDDALHDLYWFELYEAARPQPVTYVKARVIDASTRKPLIAQVSFFNLGEERVFAESLTGNDGEFLVCIPAGKSYALNVAKEGYLFHSENFDLLHRNENDQPYVLEIALQAIPEVVMTPPSTKPNPSSAPAAKPIILKNIFFKSGSAELLPTSRAELNYLYELLRDYPRMHIQINGHTDNVGTDTDNKALSVNRAKSVVEYLTKLGIERSRLSFEGYGELQPIDTNDTEEGRANNRRTEFIILN